MKTLFSAILAFCSIISLAQIPFDQTAKLQDHLLEVNTQWALVDGIESLEELVQFSSEEERIATHLALVIEKIEGDKDCETDPGGPACLLMEQLAIYASNHVFPINNKVGHRQPVFIDDLGTACAVGHLMRENGYADLAYSVKDNMNLAYVKEIPTELLTDWQTASDLSIDDMALIQPGYPPTTTWIDYGGNIEGVINDLIVYQGVLYVGGNFLLDGQPRCLAKVEDNVVVPTTINPSGEITDLEIYEDKLYACGNFNDVQNLMSWDLSVVGYSTVGMSKYAWGYKLKADGDVMYMSADASGIIAQSNVYIIQDPGWLEIGQFDQPIYAMEIYDGNLHVGGAFTNEWSSNIDASRIAMWDTNSWYAVGDGVPNTVYDFMVDGDQMMACGELRDTQGVVNFGTAELMDGNWIQPWWGGVYVDSMEETTVFSGIEKFGDQMFLWGDYEANGWTTIGQDVGYLEILAEDELWPALTPILSDMEGSVNAMIEWNGAFWIAGDFVGWNGAPSNLASSDLSTVVKDPRPISFEIYPNPTAHSVTIHSDNTIGQVTLFDTSGRIVLDQGNVRSERINLQVNQLPAGLYTAQIVLENGYSQSSQLVIEK